MIDPQLQTLLDRQAKGPYRNLFAVPLEEALAEVRGATPRVAAQSDWDGQIRDRTVPGPDGEVPIRIYSPPGPVQGQAPGPAQGALVYFHGGGWVAGSVDGSDGLCRSLAGILGWIVISVDYRLAPECRFPGALEDCYAAAQWAVTNATNATNSTKAGELNCRPRVAIGGTSAGGNLAAAVALLARDRRAPGFNAQILIYPVCDSSLDFPSFEENTAYLNRDRMAWYWAQYVQSEADKRSPYAAPLRATDFRDLPQALVVTAALDPLRDEGEAYAERLRQAGVAVTGLRCEGVTHGFFSMSLELQQSRDSLREMQKLLQQC